MKALTFDYNIPQYLLTRVLTRKWPRLGISSWAPTELREVPEPPLLGPEWVKIRPRLTGLCGSDMSLIMCHESLTLQPFGSPPFILGHEVCGEIAEAGEEVEGFEVGDRITVKPALGCATRGIDPPCAMCAQGRNQLCYNYTKGDLAPGLFVGSSGDTAGFISEMGVAHRSQLEKIPRGVSDENAVLTEPFATALHMIVANAIQPAETVVVFGCGVMGLSTLAGLRALHPEVRILAVEPDPFHGEVAREMGVSEVIRPGGKEFYRRVAELTDARMHNPIATEPFLSGGVDRVFDTVGITGTIQASLRILASGGHFNLLGIGAPKKIDWTPVWFKELTLRGIYGSQQEEVAGRRMHDFDLALSLYAEGRVDLSHMVTHRFRLDEWREAIQAASAKGKSKAIKVVFTP